MPFQFKNPQLLKDTFDKYVAFTLKSGRWAAQHKELTDRQSFDTREIGKLVILYNDFNIDMTDEEIAASTEKMLKEFKTNPTKILNKLMDFCENFNTGEADTTKEKDVLKAISYEGFNQLFSGILAANPDYMMARYGGSVTAMAKFDGTEIKSLNTGYEILNALLENNLSIQKVGENKTGYITDEEKERMLTINAGQSYNEFSANSMKWQNNFKNSLSEFLLKKKDYVEFPVDVNWGHVKTIAEGIDNKDAAEDELFGKEEYYFEMASNITEQTFGGNSFAKRVANSCDDKYYYGNVFVDGKSLDELLNPGLQKEDIKQYKREAAKLIADAIENGKPLDIVRTYSVNGLAKSQIIPLKYNYSKEATNAFQLKHHSYFRVKYFNWGPFRITDPVDYRQVNEKNDWHKEEREAKITKYWEENIASKLDGKYDEEISEDIATANKNSPERFRDFDPVKCGGQAIATNPDEGIIMNDDGALLNDNSRTNIIIDDDEKEVNNDDFNLNNDEKQKVKEQVKE